MKIYVLNKCGKFCVKIFLHYIDIAIFVLGYFILPHPVYVLYAFAQAARCAYSVLIIAVYWMTECLPMAVTSILPVVLMTWLGVIDSRVLCRSYLQVIYTSLIDYKMYLIFRSGK